jgi:hypothetical protein
MKMAPNNLTINVRIDFSQLEKLFEEYISSLSSADGEELYLSYQEHASEQINKFMKWLKDRPVQDKHE